MLKMFGVGKPDHPLADPKEARRVIDALPANDPVKALDELMHWMESVAAAEGFKPEARVQLLRPEATHRGSSEIYLVAQGYRPPT